MKSTNKIIFSISLLIALIGVLSIYSSTYQKEGDIWRLVFERQIFWIILGVLLYFVFSKINYRHLWDLSYFLYAAMLLLLVLVFALGIVRLGAQRWIKIYWFNFQPSELAKIAMVIFLARFYSTKSVSNVTLQVSRYGLWRAFLLPAIFVVIPVALIIEQPDLGTGMLIILLFATMMYVGGVRLRYLVAILLAALVLFPVLWHFLRDYQRNRIMVFLNPNIDPLGAGYTVIQSKIAIGSGGFFGKGWLSGTQSQLHFLPESHTDFIFSTFTEEWGFLGAIALLFLYFLLIRQGIRIASSTNDQFGKLLGYGISIMLCLQIVINIAMNLGLAPVVGVPLPLMSYGGSSMLVTFIALGILSNIGKTRAVF